MGNASLAQSEVETGSSVEGYLREIETASERAAGLARQMLAYSGKGKFVIEPTDVSLVVREITSLLGVSMPKKASLQLELAEQLPTVDADPTQVRQIVMNLVINAAEALGDAEGTIKVETGTREVTVHELDGAHGETLGPGRHVFLRVSDTGSGMDAATAARIFDPFFTTKFTGRGLGLAAVLGIVRGHRGAIQVATAPGAGTTFELLLPESAGAAEKPRSGRHTAHPADRSRGWALVVDDEIAVRKVAARMLGRLGFDVLEAGDGQEALDRFAAQFDSVSVVMADLRMPRMGGHELLIALRTKGWVGSAIIMSGYAEGEAKTRFSEGGVTFLAKPFALADLESALGLATGAG
jgi:CheY-like chemotaxis protein